MDEQMSLFDLSEVEEAKPAPTATKRTTRNQTFDGWTTKPTSLSCSFL